MSDFFSDREISGLVVSGRRLGRELGFPTANIELNETFEGVRGVYLACMGGDLLGYWALVNIGERPSVEGGFGSRVKAEVYILDFSGDLYGRHISFCLVEKLREELHFGSLDELRDQLDRDRDRAISLISSRNFQLR
ncbi:MAG: riboflavin kinase [Rikenellaceae bacterium]